MPQKAIVSSIQFLRPEIAVLRLKPSEGFSFQAGQYVTLGFKDLPVRPYSIANAPTANDPMIEIHVKIMPDGLVTHYIDEDLKDGESVLLDGPFGTNTYDESDRRPTIAIAGGVGITPMKSIVEAALANDDHGAKLHLFWGARSREELYLQSHFEHLAAHHDQFDFHAVVETPVSDVVLAQIPDLRDKKIHLAGPRAMIEHSVPLFQKQGAVPHDIRYDKA